MPQSRAARLVLMLVLGAIAAGAVTGCRVMSWNVHGVCGIYGNCDAEGTPHQRQWAAVIANQGFPGVVGLQEICDGPGRQDVSELVDAWPRPARRYYYYFKTTHVGSDKFHHCGNAILSVLPLRDLLHLAVVSDPVRTCSTGPQPPRDCVPEDCRGDVGNRRRPDRRPDHSRSGLQHPHCGGSGRFDSARQTAARAGSPTSEIPTLRS